MYRIGIDIGGTFTDFCLFNVNTGKIKVFKTSSTPQEPSEAIENGIVQIFERFDVQPQEIEYLAHGTTVATNAVIEHKGSKTGLITTQGFRDLLEIARQKRPSLYDLFADKPRPLVPRFLRLEVPERLNYQGEIIEPLDENAVTQAVHELQSQGVESIAVTFLHAYMNPDHERRVKAIVEREFPDAHISISSEVVPEFREYERLSTTCLNAYLMPLIKRYMEKLQQRIQRLGIPEDPYITQSNGGIMTIHTTKAFPIRTALSGPAAGVMGAVFISRLAEFGNIITFDMGGTSTDVSLIEAGTPQLTEDKDVAGYPCRIPMIDVHAVGAGGGSIAWIDQGMLLKVGPQSAGADPGPACYDLGGTEPTVTDANVVLGRLNPEYLLNGRMKIDRAKSERAIREKLCSEIKMDVINAARGILRVVTSNMVRAVRVVSVEKGYNPADFGLMAYGGAGPLHAVDVARELNIGTVIVPPAPGILCAVGLLTTDIRTDYVKTAVNPACPEIVPRLQQQFDEIEQEALAWLDSEGISEEKRRFIRSLDMRYLGQNYELLVPMENDGSRITPDTIVSLIERFHAKHKKAYGHASPGAPVQIVNCRVRALGEVPKPELQRLPERENAPEEKSSRLTYFYAAEPVKTPVLSRESLGANFVGEGPLIIEQMDSTIVVPPGDKIKSDDYGNLIISLKT